MGGSKFRDANRDQQFLLPPNLKDWLPEDHLAYFLLDVLSQVDTSSFFERYSEELRGEKPYSPRVMIPLLVYAYIDGVRSSRKIEKLCERDIAYRVIACNQQPDHSTICRFRKENKEAFTELFHEVLTICTEAGLGEIGTVSLDGVKVKADASLQANRTYQNLKEEAEKIIEEAEQLDDKEDEEYGKQNRGDELPDDLTNPDDRLERLKECKQRIENEAEQQAEKKREQIRERKKEEEETGKKKRGRKPDPPDPTPDEDTRANPTDPESRIMKDRRGYLQAYNMQAVVSEDQLIIAARATNDENDRNQLKPMVEQTEESMRKADVDGEVEVLVSDNGYWDEDDIKEVEQERDFDCLVATKKGSKMREEFEEEGYPRGRIPDDISFQELMTRRLLSKDGRAEYRKRGQTVEPVFGQIKERQRCDRLRLRGKQKADLEWKMMAMSHNLLKLWRETRKN